MLRSVLRWWRRRAQAGHTGTSAEASSPGRAPGTEAAAFDARFAAGPDPWKYDSAYEARKYEQTLALALEHKPTSALELACAEGHFTARLAPHVSRLLATDFSSVALERARLRLAAYPHVTFARLDLLTEEIPGVFDLITCCEVLYYVPRESLRLIGARLAASLGPGGRLVMAHANVLEDDPDGYGFDWGPQFGVATIARELALVPGLRRHTEFRTEYYRILVYQRPDDAVEAGLPRQIVGEAAPPLPDVERAFRRPRDRQSPASAVQSHANPHVGGRPGTGAE